MTDLAALRDLMLKARQATISRVQGCTVQGVPGEEADRAAWDAVWAELAKVEAGMAKTALERDAAYVLMIDTSGFLRGYSDVAEAAARRLANAVPENFDDREEAVRRALQGADHAD